MTYVFKIAGVPSMDHFAGLPFGKQLEYRQQFQAFKARAKAVDFLCKRKSTASGVREFLKLYKPAEYFLLNMDTPDYHDDSFKVWYVEKPATPAEGSGHGL